MYLEYEWLFEENEEMEFEEMCRIFLISHASSTQREDKSVRL